MQSFIKRFFERCMDAKNANILPEVKRFNCQDSTPEEYFCTECTFSTHLKAYFGQHIREFYCLKKENEESKLAANAYQCQKCSFWTYSELILLKHVINNIHTENSAEKCLSRVLDNGVKWYICYDCNYRTDHITSVKRHILHKHTHTEQINWFKCNDCNFKTKMKSALKRHYHNHTHDIKVTLYIKQHRCDQCEYKTRDLIQLKAHKISKHNAYDVDQLGCDFCSYKTVFARKLKDHIQAKHTLPEDIKWRKCGQCEYQAKTLSAMHWHKRVKHAADKKPLKCSHCEHIATTNQHLKKHILRKHTADENINWFLCHQCEFKSKTKDTLTAHLVKHSTVKNFQCDQCEYKSKQKSDLNKHLAKHSLLRNFQCDQCDYKCKRKQDLRRHILRKHGTI